MKVLWIGSFWFGEHVCIHEVVNWGTFHSGGVERGERRESAEGVVMSSGRFKGGGVGYSQTFPFVEELRLVRRVQRMRL